MTQPTVLFFGPDGGDSKSPKVFLRTLLFATSKRGRVVENLYVRLSRNESHQNFNIWVYGDKPLYRGSGLFVGEAGVAANHHFLAPVDGTQFEFLAGAYTIELHIKLVGSATSHKLWSQEIQIAEEHALDLKKSGAGLYFDWGPDSERYIPHIDFRAPPPSPEEILSMTGFNSLVREQRKKSEKAGDASVP